MAGRQHVLFILMLLQTHIMHLHKSKALKERVHD